MSGMSNPLVNVTHWLILHEIPRIYQKKRQERQVLGTQKRAAQLSLARRRQRHKWTGHKTFRRKSIPGNTSMNQEKKKGIRGTPHLGHGNKSKMGLTRHATAMNLVIEFPGDRVVPRQRFGPIPQFLMSGASEEGAETFVTHRKVMENL